MVASDQYSTFQTFSVDIKGGVAWTTFNFGPVNVQGAEMLADLDRLCTLLEQDTSVKYSTFQTFSVDIKGGVAWTTFNFGPVNVQGAEMLADLDRLCTLLEQDTSVKVVVFQSALPEFWVCHFDTKILKDMSTAPVSREEVQLLDLQRILERLSKVPQCTIAKVESFARGGGHEQMLACDLRYAARGKAKFMQMEVAIGILPCGGGASRMARQIGLGRALELTLSAKDWDADLAEKYGTINRAFDSEEIGPFVEDLANRIALWPSASIAATKRTVYASIDKPIDEALKEEAYQLYQALSQTDAKARFQATDDAGMQFKLDFQRNWDNVVVDLNSKK